MATWLLQTDGPGLAAATADLAGFVLGLAGVSAEERVGAWEAVHGVGAADRLAAR